MDTNKRHCGVEVRLWFQNQKLTSDQFDILVCATSERQRNRIQRFRDFKDARNSLIGDIIARQGICEKTHLPNTSLSLTTNEYGKPMISGDVRVHFSISHTDGYVAVVVDEEPVGIDIEKLNPVDLAVIGRFFTSNEQRYVKSHLPNLQLRAFYEVWTKKEAYLKWDGRGLSRPLDAFDVLHCPDVCFHRVLESDAVIGHVCTTQRVRPNCRVVSTSDLVHFALEHPCVSV